MSKSTEHTYCARQINIPVTFPYVLKSYVKAAIRTQPTDLLRWTAAYFRALANSDIPPAKARLEYPPFLHPSKITPGYLKSLLKQYRRAENVPLASLINTWRAMDLPQEYLYYIFSIGDFFQRPYCQLDKFVAVACGFLTNNLLETMIKVCEVLTTEPEGGSAMIPLNSFLRLYTYLAGLDAELPSLEDNSTTSTDEDPVQFCVCLQDHLLLCSNEFSSATCSYSRESRSIQNSTKSNSSQDQSQRDCDCEVSLEQMEGERMESIGESPSILGHLVDKGIMSWTYRRNALNSDKGELEGAEDFPREMSFDEESDDLQENIVTETHLEATRASSEHVSTSSSEPKSQTKRCLCEDLDEPAEVQIVTEFRRKMQKQYPQPLEVPGIGATFGQQQIGRVSSWLAECARYQGGFVGPRNLTHLLCPPLYSS